VRIAWAIPCVRVRMRTDGLLDLLGAQIDSVVIPALPMDVQFDIALRVVGTVQDFEVDHSIEVVLSDPGLVEAGRLRVPIPPRSPTSSHLPGYEINHHIGMRIDFEADIYGGWDLAFALDDEAQHDHRTTLSIVASP
jgi:hypothetical protein